MINYFSYSLCYYIKASSLLQVNIEFSHFFFKTWSILHIFIDFFTPNYYTTNTNNFYDEAESKEYNIPHFDEFESAIEITREKEFESDVFFAGKAKDRLPLLSRAYNQLTKAGLKVYLVNRMTVKELFQAFETVTGEKEENENAETTDPETNASTDNAETETTEASEDAEEQQQLKK